jgi:hypothetical protein
VGRIGFQNRTRKPSKISKKEVGCCVKAPMDGVHLRHSGGCRQAAVLIHEMNQSKRTCLTWLWLDFGRDQPLSGEAFLFLRSDF